MNSGSSFNSQYLKAVHFFKDTVKSFGKANNEVSFLESCISEGFIPKGIQSHFSLAYNVNNTALAESIQNACDIHSSTILDILLNYKKTEMIAIKRNVHFHCQILRDNWSMSKRATEELRRNTFFQSSKHRHALNQKLENIRDHKFSYLDRASRTSKGSRYIVGVKYIRKIKSISKGKKL